MYKKISSCRSCGGNSLISTLKLGSQFLTGVFPKDANEKITNGPLELVWCKECGLLQLAHSFSLEEMYGENYGYRSGLNKSMVQHLNNKVKMLENLVNLTSSDLVIDIGSNDATTLRAYIGNHEKIGIDPTGSKFREYYGSDIKLITDFFSKEVFLTGFPNKKAKIITSIAMFYDLESPNKFISDICSILDDNGIWHFEQSYMPSMLRTNSYDTICHEHLEFYSFNVVKGMLEKSGMRVVDVQMNSINGGSFAVTACKQNARYKSNQPIINWLLSQEDLMQINTIKPYREFSDRVFQHRDSLTGLIRALVSDGKKVFGYGASTKGNVLLQFCGFTKNDIPYIAEVNEDKFGSLTPGSLIPIISEIEAKKMKPDYFLVLPWHFKENILQREQDFIASGGKFIFPMPEIEII